MHRYTSLLGRRVELVYRFCSMELFARGILLGHTDESVWIEQQADQYGPVESIQLHIPYASIIRLNERPPDRARAANEAGRS